MSDRQERIDKEINNDELSAFERFCNKAIHPGLYPSEVIMLANRSLMVAAAYREKCAEVDDLRESLDMYRHGYQGACMACEPVALENQRLRVEIERQRQNYEARLSSLADEIGNAEADIKQLREALRASQNAGRSGDVPTERDREGQNE